MSDRKYNWRSDFRMHAFDLNTMFDLAPGEHWIFQDKMLCSMLADLEKDHQDLRARGGDGLAGARLNSISVLRKLGYHECEEPQGLLACVRFAAGFTGACVRETLGIQTQVAHLNLRLWPGWNKLKRIYQPLSCSLEAPGQKLSPQSSRSK